MNSLNKHDNHHNKCFKAAFSDPLVASSIKHTNETDELKDDELRVESLLVGTPLVTAIEASDIEENRLKEDVSAAEKIQPSGSSYLYSNYEKAKKFFLQKNYFSFKLNLTNNHKHVKTTSVFDELKFYLHDLQNHFQFIIETKPLNKKAAFNSKPTIEQKLYKLSTNYLNCLDKCIYLREILLLNASKYDLDSEHQTNGYRSLCCFLEKCCENTLITMKQIYAQKSFFMFYMKYTLFTSELNDFEAWYNLIDKIEIILSIAVELQSLSANQGYLFVRYENFSKKTEEELLMLQTTYQESFFGRTCCFQYCNSLKIPLTTFTVAMASYNDTFDATQQTSTITRTAKSLSSGTKYFMNPELRGQKIAHIMKTSNVEFCKFFSRLTDRPIFHVGTNITSPSIVINIVKTLEPKVLRITKFDEPNETVKINPPYGISAKSPLKIRILSYENREGMDALDDTLKQKRPKSPKSPYLILHAHGGGFISQSSKSHEVYLKPICKGLNVPIVSIDYSLSPEHPFPKASEECFYSYIWCLLNKDKLGWTGEKIICLGDSAGGVLVTNIAQRSIVFGIRAPDALILVYTPFLLTNSLSPSRLMSFMDPLINTGILWRSLAAYCGIELRQNTDTKTESSIKIDQNEIDLENESDEERTHRLRKTFGNCYRLAEALKNQTLYLNQYMSPLLTEEAVLKKMPKTCFIACNDTFLDDSIEMARLLRKHNRKTELYVVDNGCAHAFLNMKNLCEETRNSFYKVYSVLENTISSYSS